MRNSPDASADNVKCCDDRGEKSARHKSGAFFLSVNGLFLVKNVFNL